ncbi:MAG: hypothetical protein H0X45_02735 [Planctomycetes bacterium]|nr:hypothetical protein [Planctomycetota bacterium]
MIIINLLPPELRRRGAGISPAFASIVGGGALNVLLLLFFLWLQFVQIPNAETKLAETTSDLEAKTALAQQVLDRKQLIAQYEDRRDVVVNLLASKMFMARNLDDFANMLSGKWVLSSPNGGVIELPNVEVRALEFAVSESATGSAGARGAAKVDEVVYAYKWRYQIIGPDQKRGGDYVKAFFFTTEQSAFWQGRNKDGFLGQPEDNYSGDRPEWQNTIQRLVIENTIEWKRRKTVEKTLKPKPKKTAAIDDGGAPIVASRGN